MSRQAKPQARETEMQKKGKTYKQTEKIEKDDEVENEDGRRDNESVVVA